MITGSVASIVYGEPRVTHDVDLVIELRRPDTGRFVALFPIEEFYCPPSEIVEQEALRELRGHFNLIHHKSGFKADVYLANRDPFHAWALKRRIAIGQGEDLFHVAPIEYVIVRKLEFYKEGEIGKTSPRHSGHVANKW